MSRTILLTIVAGAGVIVAGACGGDTNISVNTANTNRSAVNSTMNTAGNAVNTVANTVTSVTTDSPADFLINAARGGMVDVEMGKLAAQKSKNAEIKKFGQMMADDHSKVNTELKALAGKKNVTLPTDLGSYKDSMESMKASSPGDFDKEYVDQMVRDHESTVTAFKRQADSGADAEVKAFAAKTLPTLLKHLEMIKAIEEELHK